MKPPLQFETPRLLLRPPSLGDADAIFHAYASDPEVTKYLIWRPHKSPEETRNFLTSCINGWRNGTECSYVITKKPDNQALGMLALRIALPKVDLGYVLSRAHWGQGIVTEALKALLQWASAQPEVIRISATCDVDNPASAKVMEKAGMTLEGRLTKHTVHPNIEAEPRDVFCYSMVK